MVSAIVIARGGSRRLPRKNVLPFCGHPLIAWTIVQAKTSELVDRVIMCTDDDEIENISLKYGAEVVREPVREHENAPQAFLYAMDQEDIQDGEVLTMLPTSPIRRPRDIDFTIEERRRYGTGQMGPHVVLRENCPALIIGKNQLRGQQISKNNEYVTGAMGFSAWDTRYYRASIAWEDGVPMAEYEKKINEGKVPQEWWFWPVPWWTQFEVDTEEEFKFCEVIMEHYILKGRTMEEVYVEPK